VRIHNIILGTVLAILFSIVFLILLNWLFNPQCPSTWSAISRGMTEQEVAEIMRGNFDVPPGPVADPMGESRNVMYSVGAWRPYSGRQWALHIHYDASRLEAGYKRRVENVMIVEARFPFTFYLRKLTVLLP
jgi:hypothetical protein